MLHLQPSPQPFPSFVPPPVGVAGGAPEPICLEVIARVAPEFWLAPAALMAPTRGAPHAAFARQVAMYLAHVGFALSFGAIGRQFGRDRTTVAHACRVVEDLRDIAWFDRWLAALERDCRPQPRAAQTRGGRR